MSLEYRRGEIKDASFLANVGEFKRLNQLPVPLKFEEDMDVKKLVTHQAKWHKSCYLKFNDTKLRKREHDKNNDNSTTLQNQSCLQHQSMDKKKMYFLHKG